VLGEKNHIVVVLLETWQAQALEHIALANRTQIIDLVASCLI
jgi:hypothetical protein